jgi:uncharacterized protein (DUF433 family)
MTITAYQHIAVDNLGVAWIAGRQVKVLEVVAEHLAYRWDAEQLRSQHPDLTLGEIHSALAYYYDHEQAMEQEIDARLKRADQLANRAGLSKVRQKIQTRSET